MRVGFVAQSAPLYRTFSVADLLHLGRAMNPRWDDDASEIRQASHGYRLVWGGDFNQGLAGREHVGSLSGRGRLLSTFDGLGLAPVTGNAAGRRASEHAVDHVAVPDGWALERLAVERPRQDGAELSDHPAYQVTLHATPPVRD